MRTPADGIVCYDFFVKHEEVSEARRVGRDVRIVLIFLCICALLYGLFHTHTYIVDAYDDLLSRTITDRNGDVIMRAPNSRGAYTRMSEVPVALMKLVVLKEDRWFYWHPGVNPWSVIRVSFEFARGIRHGGASTITQQLAKILLHQEADRTLLNKTKELWVTFALELMCSKAEILDMYAQSVYMGNSVQGFPEASMWYFGKPLSELDHNDLFSLVATLGSPSTRNPWADGHEAYTRSLGAKLKIPWEPGQTTSEDGVDRDGRAAFELRALHALCGAQTCQSTIDQEITEKLRRAARELTRNNSKNGVTNTAIVVLTLPSRELLAIIGSPDPRSSLSGSQINMATKPRQIGSTIKPLIYALGFMHGLRPYSLVSDEEYRYDIATGFPLYPKNYDGAYHGMVTLDHALANSLNVPAVKVLEFVGVENFTQTLTDQLAFVPQAPIESYQFGIALGGLEMDLMTLTHTLSLFGTKGTIGPIQAWLGSSMGEIDRIPPMSHIASTTRIVGEGEVALVNKILTDRAVGVEQFGLNNNLLIPGVPVAVKTGTSRDYHDSWTVGWTPDFIVGVWVGNAENKALDQVSGSSGAGKLWHDSMEILLNSPYNKHSPFIFTGLTEHPLESGITYGLMNDDFTASQELLIDAKLIRSPHDGDTFLSEPQTVIPLISRDSLSWSVNGSHVGTGMKLDWGPTHEGTYLIVGTDGVHEESVTITVVEKN